MIYSLNYFYNMRLQSLVSDRVNFFTNTKVSTMLHKAFAEKEFSKNISNE